MEVTDDDVALIAPKLETDHQINFSYIAEIANIVYIDKIIIKKKTFK